jgi:hypothetical protein
MRGEITGRQALERCEVCGKLFATLRFREHVSERTTVHPDVKEHHRYCPTCAKLFSYRLKSASFKRLQAACQGSPKSSQQKLPHRRAKGIG